MKMALADRALVIPEHRFLARIFLVAGLLNSGDSISGSVDF
jgi:hypothetical protein